MFYHIIQDNYILQCQLTKTPLIDFDTECDFINGQAYGGTEKFVGEKATSQECFMFVKEYYPAARGAVWQAVDTNGGGEGNCMVLISNTGVDDNPTYQTCLFEGEIKSLEELLKYSRNILNGSSLPLVINFSLL